MESVAGWGTHTKARPTKDLESPNPGLSWPGGKVLELDVKVGETLTHWIQKWSEARADTLERKE